MNADVGRPMPRLKFNIDLPWLEQVMLDVIRDAQTKQYEVQDKGGWWYRFRLSPYKTLDKRIDGVVLSVTEMEERQPSATGSDGKGSAKAAKAAATGKSPRSTPPKKSRNH
jgi:hypothetical protein